MVRVVVGGIDLEQAGASPQPLVRLHPAIERDRWEMALPSPEAFWPVIMGTSNRGAYEALSPPAQDRVRSAVISALRARHVTATAMECLYAVARKAPVVIDD